MRVKNVDFLLTFKCPAKCKHCSYKAGPEREGQMKLADAENYLEELTDTHPLQSICAHGGEPFLHLELLKGIMKMAKELGIPRTWVITNGYWAKTKTIAKKKLAELRNGGLSCITFSVDAFHQEYVSLETVKNGIEAAKSVGFEKVCVDSYFLMCPGSGNSYDVATRASLESLRELDNVNINTYQVRFKGRAAELANHVKGKTQVPKGKCQLPFWIGGDLKSPEAIEIDCEGNVTLCPGICIGNTRKQSLIRILQNYDYHSHPILSIIAEEGPIGLLKTAIAKGLRKDMKFVDECHLCYEMRKLLRPYYPRCLAPAECY